MKPHMVENNMSSFKMNQVICFI